MYKLLIVDDESYIVEGSAEILQNESSLELEIYKAYTAYEALDWMDRTRIDIMVADICMPGMDGMALLDKVSRTWPDCKVIFLSGHAEFEYAHEAIRKNVISYILKTEDDEEIIKAVRKAADLIDREIKNTELLNNAEKEMAAALPAIRREFIYSLLMGDYYSAGDIKTQMKSMGIEINSDAQFLLLIGRIDNLPTKTAVYNRFEIINSIKMIVDHYISQAATVVAIEYEHTKMVWIIQPLPGSMYAGHAEDMVVFSRLMGFIRSVLEIIQKSCRENIGIDISFALDHYQVDVSTVSDSFKRLNLNLDTLAMQETGIIISSEMNRFQTDTSMLQSDSQLENTLQRLNKLDLIESLLREGKEQAFYEGFDEICKALKAVKSKNDNQAQEVYYRIALMLLSYINRNRLAEYLAFHIQLHALTRHDMLNTWSEAVDYLKQLSGLIFRAQKEKQMQLGRDLVSYIRTYIDRHLGEDISLVKLSEISGYNSSYLSRLYKNITGETLQDYINSVRIKKVKELMNNKKISISDIAAMTGYASRTYFNRFFKKFTGMTPQEYRQNMLKE